MSNMLERLKRLGLSMPCHKYDSWQGMARTTNTNLFLFRRRCFTSHRNSMSLRLFFLDPGIQLLQPSKLRVLINIAMGEKSGPRRWQILICGSRISVNVVSGWFKQEFTSIGQWWLDHGERYRRSREFITCLRGIWTQENFNFAGDFYQVCSNAPIKSAS